MIQTLGNAFILLAQLKSDATKGDPPFPSENIPSDIVILIIGLVLLIGILVVAFRPAKRDRIEK